MSGEMGAVAGAAEILAVSAVMRASGAMQRTVIIDRTCLQSTRAFPKSFCITEARNSAFKSSGARSPERSFLGTAVAWGAGLQTWVFSGSGCASNYFRCYYHDLTIRWSGGVNHRRACGPLTLSVVVFFSGLAGLLTGSRRGVAGAADNSRSAQRSPTGKAHAAAQLYRAPLCKPAMVAMIGLPPVVPRGASPPCCVRPPRETGRFGLGLPLGYLGVRAPPFELIIVSALGGLRK